MCPYRCIHVNKPDGGGDTRGVTIFFHLHPHRDHRYLGVAPDHLYMLEWQSCTRIDCQITICDLLSSSSSLGAAAASAGKVSGFSQSLFGILNSDD